MKVYYSISDFPSDIETIVTIGTFDGVHKGHKQVINRLDAIAKKKKYETVLLTFFPHPRHVLHPQNNQLMLLSSLEEKIEELRNSGLQHFIIHKFTKKFSRIKSINFIRDILVNNLQMKCMVVGHDHHFGRNREGSYNELLELSHVYDFELERISPVYEEDLVVSSTEIRTLLLNGNINQANILFGYLYSMKGEVVKGESIARKIGYPTANILPKDCNKLIPCEGVYAVNVILERKRFYGMLNIGFMKKKIEVHIFDFHAEIYGSLIKVEFVKRLRKEKKFENLDGLKHQVQIDEVNCRKVFEI